MSEPVLDAVLELRSFLFEAVYENTTATAEFKKGGGHSDRACGKKSASARTNFSIGGRSSRRRGRRRARFRRRA